VRRVVRDILQSLRALVGGELAAMRSAAIAETS
jgi:uncharacterized protein YbjQ (UPF0145 family)